MTQFLNYISKDKPSSLFGYEIDLRTKGARPYYLGQSNDGKTYYALYNAEVKIKYGRNKEIKKGEFYNIPNQIKTHF